MSISVGENASLTRTLTEEDVRSFAELSRDFNPVHMKAAGGFDGKSLCHGMLVASMISAVLGTYLPGPGTIYLEQMTRFVKPVFVGDTVTARVEVTALRDSSLGKIVTLETSVWNQEKLMVISGQAKVLSPMKE